MLKNSKAKLLVLFLLLFLFLGASFILAQKPLEVAYPELPGIKTPATTKEALPDYIRYIFHLGLFLAGLLAFGSFVYGGFRYLASGGSSSAQKDAASQITSGLLGLAILLFAFVVLNTINPQLTDFDVSLPNVSLSNFVVSLPKIDANTYLEIPLGGLIENLWGKRNATYPSGFKPIDCYAFDSDGDPTSLLENNDRLDCIKKLSEAIKIKAEKLKEPVEELSRYYTCNNCCEDCCDNACSNWVICADVCNEGGVWPWWEWTDCESTCCQGTQNEGCWGSCGDYDCCEGLGMDGWKSFCPGCCCEYFEECSCYDCLGSICRDPDDKTITCDYEDAVIQDLIAQIKATLVEFQVKMGFFPLTEKMRNSDNLDQLLANSETKTLIKNLLFYQEPSYNKIDKNKLKNILKIKEVMTYLVSEWPYRDLLFSNQNFAKTAARILGALENEVAVNEISWMGTQAEPDDEWIELYNNTQGSIDLSDWKLVVKDKLEIELSGTIPAQGFYLLESNKKTISDIEDDLIKANLNLSNDGEILELYDQFGNLVEEVNCQTGWFAGREEPATSMERINPQGGGSDEENWLNNLSSDVIEEQKKDFINGEDRDGEPIYGTPKEPNSHGLRIAPYSSLDFLSYQISEKINEEELKEKLILFLRKDENLEKIIKKNEEFLVDVLIGENDRLKRLLKEREVLRVLFENEESLNAILEIEDAENLFRQLLNMAEPEKNDAWQDLITNKLTETVTNSKIISDFEEDLSWVVEAGDMMQGCPQGPISIDQARVPESFSGMVIEKVPEWEEIETNLKLPGETEASHDPAIFYCHKILW